MVSAVNTGSLNMPKMLRHLAHRSSQVRDLVFIRDAVYAKDTRTKKSNNSTDLAGPAVNFGYETTSTTTQADGTNTSYYLNTPQLVLPGLKMLQSPINSRSGKLERTGTRISGACTFYAPSLSYISSLENFGETAQFSELETYDKLLDVERIVYNPADTTFTGASKTLSISSGSTYNPGYELDRVQFKIRANGINLTNIKLVGDGGVGSEDLAWAGTLVLNSTTNWITVDLPIRDIAALNTTTVYKDGSANTFTAAVNGSFNLDKLYGGVSSAYLSSLIITLSSSASVELKDIYLYKEAEWRIESIRDYRDEYMQIGAVRVRGERSSRRRTYG